MENTRFAGRIFFGVPLIYGILCHTVVPLDIYPAIHSGSCNLFSILLAKDPSITFLLLLLLLLLLSHGARRTRCERSLTAADAAAGGSAGRKLYYCTSLELWSGSEE